MTSTVYQFRITLHGVEPPVWRRIQVPAGYSFWDLHVAIQDSMGWLDYHLHAFRSTKAGFKDIGIPDGENDADTLAGWKVSLSKHFKQPGNSIAYSYDFGDGWEHEVQLEGVLLAEQNSVYPKCLDGRRACPPEDCGGSTGYARLLQVLQAPGTEMYEEKTSWLREHAKNYLPFRSEYFDPKEVCFSNPAERLVKAIQS